MARAFYFFLISLFFILIKPSVPGQKLKTDPLPENSRRSSSIGSSKTLNHIRCYALLANPRLRSNLLCRGGQGEDLSKLEEMPTLIPTPRLVGTKECPPEEIIKTFHAPALKKDILVKA